MYNLGAHGNALFSEVIYLSFCSRAWTIFRFNLSLQKRRNKTTNGFRAARREAAGRPPPGPVVPGSRATIAAVGTNRDRLRNSGFYSFLSPARHLMAGFRVLSTLPLIMVMFA